MLINETITLKSLIYSDSMQSQFKVTFWGVRGSIACPGQNMNHYGGNTSCVEMKIATERLIFDGGTGLRLLGKSLTPEMPLSANLFFTHSHWDHIQGFPFFTPAFIKGNHFKIYGPSAPNGSTLKQSLHEQMLHPNFPVPLQIMQADLEFYDIEPGDSLEIGEINIQTTLLNHPGEAIGYRVNYQGHSVCYITDTEHFQDRLDHNIVNLVRESDLLIIDTTFTDEEYYNPKFPRVGWGHSTWQEAVKIAQAAQIKQLVLFHHDPNHDDQFLDNLIEEVILAFPNSIVAREGLTIKIN